MRTHYEADEHSIERALRILLGDDLPLPEPEDVKPDYIAEGIS